MLLSGNMSDESPAAFSLELGDDLVEMRDWLHGFAESVIGRPPRSGTSVRKPRGRFWKRRPR